MNCSLEFDLALDTTHKISLVSLLSFTLSMPEYFATFSVEGGVIKLYQEERPSVAMISLPWWPLSLIAQWESAEDFCFDIVEEVVVIGIEPQASFLDITFSLRRC